MNNKRFCVIDTNILISAFIKSESMPGYLIKHAVEIKDICPVYSQKMIDEYLEVAKRDKFGFNKKMVENTISKIMSYGLKIESKEYYHNLIDMKDLEFLNVYLTCREKEDTYLVTGNLKHFPVDVNIVSPKMMLSIINAEEVILS